MAIINKTVTYYKSSNETTVSIFNNLKFFCESSLLPLFRTILCSFFPWSSDDKLEKFFGSSLYSQVDLLVHSYVYSTAY